MTPAHMHRIKIPSENSWNTTFTLVTLENGALKKPQSDITDVLSLTKMIHMKTTVPYLPDHMGMDIKVFEASELSQQYYLDTVHCVTKRKCFNVMCMYDTFGEYCGIPGKDVKAKLIEELENNTSWYTMASAACLGMRGIQYMDWIKKLNLLEHGLMSSPSMHYASCSIGTHWFSIQAASGLHWK